MLERSSFRLSDVRSLAEGNMSPDFSRRAVLLDSGTGSAQGALIRGINVGGIPVSLRLAESGADSISRASVTIGAYGATVVDVNVTACGERVGQVLDYYLADSAGASGRADGFFIVYARAPREKLIAAVEKCSFGPEQLPVSFALDVSCIRLAFESLERMALECGSPRELLRRALNSNIDSALAHEFSHIEESRIHGAQALPRVVKEALAYFLQAAYSDPADAFRSMLLRGFEIQLMMPSFDAALRNLGPACFCVERPFLRKWAIAMADAIFRGNCGKPHGELVLKQRIIGAQTSDFIKDADMPLIERAVCNPNLRAAICSPEALVDNKNQE